MLTVDDLHLAPGSLMLAEQVHCRGFVDQQMGSGDKVALVTTAACSTPQRASANTYGTRRPRNGQSARLSVHERQATSSADICIINIEAELMSQNDPVLELAVAGWCAGEHSPAIRRCRLHGAKPVDHRQPTSPWRRWARWKTSCAVCVSAGSQSDGLLRQGCVQDRHF